MFIPQLPSIYIYRQLQRVNGEVVFSTLKNDKPRRITPAPFVMQKLQEQKLKQMEQKLKAGSAWSNEKNLFFTNELGGHVLYQRVYEHFKHMGLPAARFQDLRHSYAVAALQAGDNVKTVQENLGHHTAAFTLDTYGHTTEQMKKESAASMDKFIQSVTI